MTPCKISADGKYYGLCGDYDTGLQEGLNCTECLHKGYGFAFYCDVSNTDYCPCATYPVLTTAKDQCTSWCENDDYDMEACISSGKYSWMTTCQSYPKYGYCLTCECLQNGIPVTGMSCDACLTAGYTWQAGYTENTTGDACPSCSCSEEPAPYPAGYQCSSQCTNAKYTDYDSCLYNNAQWIIFCSIGVASCVNGTCLDSQGNTILGDCQYCLSNGYSWVITDGTCGQTSCDCSSSPPPSPSGYACISSCSNGAYTDYTMCLTNGGSWVTTCTAPAQNCTSCQCTDAYGNIIVGDCQYCLTYGYTWQIAEGTCGESTCNCASSPAASPGGYACISSCSNGAYTDYAACIDSGNSWNTTCSS